MTTVFLPRCEQCENCATDGKLPCTPGTETNSAGLLPGSALRLHRDGQDVHHHVGSPASRPTPW